MAEGDSGLPGYTGYSGDPRLREQVEEAQRRYLALPVVERIRHDMAQQLSFIRSGGYEPGDAMRVTLRVGDVEALIKQATGKD